MRFVTRVIAWALLALFGVTAVAFVIGSPQDVTLAVFGIPDTLTLPLSAAVLAAAGFGFLIGGTVMWFSDGHWRRLTRRYTAELQIKRQEVEALKVDLARARAEADAAERLATPLPSLPTTGLPAPGLPTSVGDDNRQVPALGRGLR